jgi:hypothetical protein
MQRRLHAGKSSGSHSDGFPQRRRLAMRAKQALRLMSGTNRIINNK